MILMWNSNGILKYLTDFNVCVLELRVVGLDYSEAGRNSYIRRPVTYINRPYDSDTHLWRPQRLPSFHLPSHRVRHGICHTAPLITSTSDGS